MKAYTQVRKNITQVARNNAPVSLFMWLALNDGNGNTIQIKSLQTAAVCIVQEQTSWQLIIVKKQIDASFPCVCPIVASWIPSYFDNAMMNFTITNRTDTFFHDKAH